MFDLSLEIFQKSCKKKHIKVFGFQMLSVVADVIRVFFFACLKLLPGSFALINWSSTFFKYKNDLKRLKFDKLCIFAFKTQILRNL